MNGLSFLAVVEAQQPFPRAVDRDAGRRDLGPTQLVMFGEPLSERLRQIGHRREVADTAMIDPVPQLAGAELLSPKRGHFLNDFGAPQTYQIGAGRGRLSRYRHAGDMGRAAAAAKLTASPAS